MLSDLDPIINGGLRKGSLILLAGNPGTGKTIFAAHFLHSGIVEREENAVYLSFLESRKSFLEYMRSFGFKFDKLEQKGKFKFLDMLTVKEEGISTVLQMALGEVQALKARRLVVDSFSAMAQAFKEPIEARIILHTILGKIVRQMECTTLVVVEDEDALRRMEGYVADGVLIFRRLKISDRLVRELEIAKLRGADLKQQEYVFTLSEGFQIFAPQPLYSSERKPKPFEGIPHIETHYSTGIADFDRILGGGFRRGSYVLLEISTDVPFQNQLQLTGTIALNYIWNGGAVVTYPQGGLGPELLEQLITPFLRPGVKLADVYRFITAEKNEWKKPYVVPLESVSSEGLVVVRGKAEEKLKDATGMWPLYIFGMDSYEAEISKGDLAIEHSRINDSVKRTEARRSLHLALARSEQKSISVVAGMAHYHFRLFDKNGCLLLYGLRPRTELFAVEPRKKGVGVSLTAIH